MTFPDRARVLLSYAYVTAWAKEGTGYLRGADLLVDSGAFTAFTKGQKINLREYIDFLLENAANVTHAAALDVIGDWKGSARNYDLMREAIGDRVELLPAWHLGSPLEELHRLCEETKYLAIGGCVPYARQPKVLMRHLIQAHKVAAEHGARLHGLGITGPTTMRRLPWRSVDSSSWVASHRFGGISLADRHGQPTDIEFGKPPTASQMRLLRAYGMDPARVASPDYNLIGKAGKVQGTADRLASVTAAARSFMHLESCMRVGAKSDFNLFLAAGNSSYSNIILNAHKLGSPFPSLERIK